MLSSVSLQSATALLSPWEGFSEKAWAHREETMHDEIPGRLNYGLSKSEPCNSFLTTPLKTAEHNESCNNLCV